MNDSKKKDAVVETVDGRGGGRDGLGMSGCDRLVSRHQRVRKLDDCKGILTRHHTARQGRIVIHRLHFGK